MKIIVTGGAGFIGSHVVDTYTAAGHRVVVIDDLSTGLRKNLHPKAKFYKADINDAKAIEAIFKKEKPEIVNHHAAMIEVVRSFREPAMTFKTNVIGMGNLLNAFGTYGKKGKKKFIFASSGGALYGDPKKIPAVESAKLMPLSPYALSKLLGEEMLEFYARHFGFDFTVLRYANVFGPRQNARGEAGVVAIFGRLMKEGKRPTIFGDGTKGRDYVHVSDIARANLLALKRGSGETVNIGLGKIISDRVVFDAIAKALRFGQEPIFAPYRKGEVYRSSLDAGRAKKILGWRPVKSFNGGVQEMFRKK
ncbi:MAG: NAD-dependent epimerase/dehydratase family protein [Minisyncoccia bacterium]